MIEKGLLRKLKPKLNRRGNDKEKGEKKRRNRQPPKRKEPGIRLKKVKMGETCLGDGKKEIQSICVLTGL